MTGSKRGRQTTSSEEPRLYEFRRQDSAIEPPHPRYPASGSHHVRRQGSRHKIPADQGRASAEGRTQRPGDSHRRRRVRHRQRFRRSVPDPEFRQARTRRTEVHPIPHHRVVLADAAGAAHGAQPSLGRHGRHHRNRDRRARLQLGVTEHQGAARADPQAQWLLDFAIRQVPRGPGVADESGGPVQRVAVGRRRIRVLLRLHRRREQPMGSGLIRGHDAHRAAENARRGLSPDRRSRGQGDCLDAAAESAAAGQAVLHVLRAGRHARAASRPEGVDRQVQGQVRAWLGQAARDHVQAPERDGRDRRRRRADAAARRDSGLGRNGSEAEAGARARNGSVRGVHGAHRPSCRPADRRAEGPRGARRHADLL